MPTTTRMDLVRQLRHEGWVHDRLCAGLQLGDDTVGGPTYMRDGAGRYFAVDENTRVALQGAFRSREVEGRGQDHHFDGGCLCGAAVEAAEA